MSYTEVEKLLLTNKKGKAHRKDWNCSWTNDHIFYDKLHHIMRTSHDWPQPYRPSIEDLAANDFIYEPQ